MSIQDAYNRWATTYDQDRNLTRDLDASVTQQLLRELPAGVVLEIGCGAGKNTIWLSRAGWRVLGLDFSIGMLQQAQRKLPSAPVVLAVANVTRPWPCRAQAVDLVNANLVLEHTPILAAIFAEARRCLRPGGHFLVSELHPARQHLGVKARFQHADAVIEIPSFVHDLTDYLTTAAEQGFALIEQRDWRHLEDEDSAPPRLASFVFRKRG